MRERSFAYVQQGREICRKKWEVNVPVFAPTVVVAVMLVKEEDGGSHIHTVTELN